MLSLSHVAIIMDGNGRWAKKRFLPRVAGHVKGVSRVKQIVRHCATIGIPYLTLFAFGRENWQRPADEVSFLMKLLSEQITKEFTVLHHEGVKIRFIGDKSRLSETLLAQIEQIQQLTIANNKLNLDIALDYSGSYDIMQAIDKLKLSTNNNNINEANFEGFLLTNPAPPPDLLIRTGGEHRLSNFMLWQSAYSELYFTDDYWPDFGAEQLDIAIKWYLSRERRFGKISEQL